MPDLEQAMTAMKQAETELAQAKVNLESGQRNLRTAEYTLNAYARNPPEFIDNDRLGVMQNDAAWKAKILGPLKVRVTEATRKAEDRRRDVRASLTTD